MAASKQCQVGRDWQEGPWCCIQWMTYIQKHISDKVFLCDKLQTLLRTHISLPSMPGNPTLRKIWVVLSFSTSVHQCLSNLGSSGSIWLLFPFKWAVYQVLWACLGFFPFILKTASDPVLITVDVWTPPSRALWDLICHVYFGLIFGLPLGCTWYILIISANPSSFRKLHFLCVVLAVSFSHHKGNDLHMETAVPSMQNGCGKFRRQINWYKNLKCMWSTKCHKICLCKWNSFQTLSEIPFLMSEANYL